MNPHFHEAGAALLGVATENKTALQMSLFLGLFAFVVGVIFNFGVLYSEFTAVKSMAASQNTQIIALQGQLTPINEQLARQDALLSDIRAELRRQNDNQKK
ncbi:MAG: hypothetical protein B7X03_03630 [Parcubacteria group bacterium 21-58-10]|nr:MAG: hypothetical protein B7X03_03630 [Parcubacteria group bacterium 21-58-10]